MQNDVEDEIDTSNVNVEWSWKNEGGDWGLLLQGVILGFTRWKKMECNLKSDLQKGGWKMEIKDLVDLVGWIYNYIYEVIKI